MTVRLLLASAVALAVAHPAAQTFKTIAELVTVPVTVTSRSGDVQISGLTAEDLRIFEDGVEQRITFVDRERRPVSLCIVLDSSNSMEGKKQELAAATVDRMVAGLGPEDEASLVVFAGTSDVVMPWTPAREVPQIDWTQVESVRHDRAHRCARAGDRAAGYREQSQAGGARCLRRRGGR